ncbi:OB-fold domain-containing protein [uncultured Pseudacidovorax sp.]|uniref:Zn-ribbon domain-containing OB-fold protein n=1 Tax=uncultured Pseudacidovorax sp. TaxID=679313 RepID=UPI0025FC0AEA|nr:OB-fold domain-containing protein [uncultured Pseudacidovorax sp.]
MTQVASPSSSTAPIHPEQDYLRFLAEGRFMLLRSRASGQHVFYPRVAQPRTGDTDLEWVPASGNGTVYATTVVRQRPPVADYNVALVDLDEGVRMMARVDGVAPTSVVIGMRLKARIVAEGDAHIVVFEAATAA